MAKTEKETEEKATPKAIGLTQVSQDNDNGIVVFDTNADDGTGFTAVINGHKVKANAQNGQVWFYAGASIGTTPVISLV